MTYSYQYAKRHGYRSTLHNPYKFRYKVEKNGTFSADVPSLLDGIRFWTARQGGGVEYTPGIGSGTLDLVSLQRRYDEIVRAREDMIQQEVRGVFIPTNYR